jgi:phosphoribosylformylglycinamidine synthase
MKYKVEIKIKEAVHDPQGQALENVLSDLGYSEIKNIRVGKLIEFEVEGLKEEVLNKVSKEVFSNPVIEDYKIYKN